MKRPPRAASDSPGWGTVAACVLAAAAAWRLAFEVHLWIDTLVQGDSGLHWVFLPAAVGLLAVLVGHWAGAGGIFIGSLLTAPQHFGDVPLDGLIGAALCALAPMLGMLAWRRLLRVPPDLRGMRPWHLAALALLYALFSASSKTLFYWLRDLVDEPLQGLLTIVVGELAGILIGVYLLRGLLQIVDRLRGRAV